MFKKILEYLRFPSTWKGIVTFATAIAGFFGFTVTAEMGAAISAAGIALVGVIDIFFSDADVTPPASKV